jgi:plasmid maintenance system antidote protein VapI
MALRLEKAFGVSLDTLMRMQNSYDIAQTRKRAGEIKVVRYKGKPPARRGGGRARRNAEAVSSLNL